MTAPADVLISVVPVVLAAAFLLLIVQSMGDRATGLVDKMKQAIGGAVMLLVTLLVVFAFLGGGGGDDPGPDPPEPAEEYDVLFHVASDSLGYGTVSISGLSDVPEGTSVTVGQTIIVGTAGQCAATPAADTSEYVYAFSHWTGADNADTPAPTSITADTHYYAHFTRTVKTYTAYFHVATDSAGYGTVSVQSVQAVPYGTSVTVAQTIAVGAVGQCTATPSADTSQYSYAFAGWTGADDDSTPAPETVMGDVNYYAHFSRTLLPMDPALFIYLTSGGNIFVKGWAGTPPADGYDLYLPNTDDQGNPLYGVNGNNDSGYVSPFSGASALNAPSVVQVATRAFQDCTLLTSVNLPSAINVYSAAFKGCTAIERVTFGPLANLGSSDSFPDWTFYDTDGTTVLSKTAANLKNSTFVGTASALIKVAPGAKSLSEDMERRVAELTAENQAKAAMLAEIDPALAGMDPSDVARMTVDEIRSLTPEDVESIKADIERRRAADDGEPPGGE